MNIRERAHYLWEQNR
ncbi:MULTISPECIES: DUF2934 domain-containing protein [Elizabethkingia]|nr:DUF2934 domain-containing protein [Elizabethkingia anophelis]EHM8032174.1 DUF2934 domain-containing protein [Elizabethkingia anophelis]EHM8033933.1 DUF2934 domain-containing protein [Elizabethkingia anophelis]EHZ9535128.1 DUF2934 domain-containing protein [Elizabethkingia anophelis]EKU3673039.1 DUF2934 domain-containing protein [Elizabethkingia anophelis]